MFREEQQPQTGEGVQAVCELSVRYVTGLCKDRTQCEVGSYFGHHLDLGTWHILKEFQLS